MNFEKKTGSQMYFSLLKQSLAASLYDESAWQATTMRNNSAFDPKTPLRSLTRAATNWVLKALNRRSLTIVKRKPYDPVARRRGLDWPMFGYTMVGIERLTNIEKCVEQVLQESIPGDFIETGVWRGGSGILIRAILKWHDVKDRIVWLADSFEGLPKPNTSEDLRGDGYDLSGVDYLKVSEEQVRENFERFDLLDDQVRFLKGWFKDTLHVAPIDKLAMLRLDGDLYESTMDALKALYHKVSPGGFVIVDDYGTWPPCKQAVTDFLKMEGLQVEIQEIDGSGVYWRIPVGAS